MGKGFWVRRFLWWYAVAFPLIAGGQWLLRGRSFDQALGHGLLWALITAALVVGILLFRSRPS